MLIKIRKIPEHKEFLLEVEQYYTGLTIQKKIEYFYNISCDQYVLTYESVRVKHTDTVSDLDIEDRDILNLIDIHHMPPESFVINCKTSVGKTIRISVLPSFTIETFRNMVFGATGMPPKNYRLLFEGKHLVDDELTLSTYGLKHNSVVHLMLDVRGS